MQVWNVLRAARWKYSTQKIVKKSPSGHHPTTLTGYIFSIKAHIDNRKKLVKHQYLSVCSHNMVNFGPLAAEIDPVVWGTPANFNGFRVLLFKHQRQRTQSTYMPVKSSAMNVCMPDNETRLNTISLRRRCCLKLPPTLQQITWSCSLDALKTLSLRKTVSDVWKPGIERVQACTR